MKPDRFIGLAIAVLLGTSPVASMAQEQHFVSVGTGGVTGVYYPVGGAMCRLMNQNGREHGFRCSVESTDGSVFNVKAIKTGDLEFGVVQSDVQYNAFNGEGIFERVGGHYPALRSVFSLYAEPLTVVARADAKISMFDDLRGKRVNIGRPGSGQRSLMDLLIEQKGWTDTDFSLAAELAPAEQAYALCDNNIDAFAYTVGHPAGAIKEATITCDSVIVPVEGEIADRLMEESPYYLKEVIPGGMYRGAEEDVNTFGVVATLVTSADVPEDEVYVLVKSVFDNFDSFRSLHPALAKLTPEQMVNRGNSAPMHPGAKKYYEERGWLN